MKLSDQLGDGSKAVASRRHVEFDYGEPITEPIVHSSTYRVKSVQQFLDAFFKGGYMYVRYSNPTCEAAEVTIKALEGGAGAWCSVAAWAPSPPLYSPSSAQGITW